MREAGRVAATVKMCGKEPIGELRGSVGDTERHLWGNRGPDRDGRVRARWEWAGGVLEPRGRAGDRVLAAGNAGAGVPGRVGGRERRAQSAGVRACLSAGESRRSRVSAADVDLHPAPVGARGAGADMDAGAERPGGKYCRVGESVHRAADRAGAATRGGGEQLQGKSGHGDGAARPGDGGSLLAGAERGGRGDEGAVRDDRGAAGVGRIPASAWEGGGEHAGAGTGMYVAGDGAGDRPGGAVVAPSPATYIPVPAPACSPPPSHALAGIGMYVA